MIRRFVVLLVVFVFLVGFASSGFYVQKDNGERVKVAPSENARENADSNSPVAQSVSGSSSSVDYSALLNLSGGTMTGGLDMDGNPLTGLPYPESPGAAATKAFVESEANQTVVREEVVNGSVDLDGYATEEYVDEKVSGINTSSGSLTGLSSVLENSNVVDRPLKFPKGVMLGSGAYAEPSGFALGRESSASSFNSMAFGQEASVEENGTAVFGSSNSSMDVKVTGDLGVAGDVEGVKKSREVWSYSFATDPNGTEVSVPEEVSGSYSVSVTPVGSMVDTGVFNKSESGFIVKSSEFTQVDVQVAELTG